MRYAARFFAMLGALMALGVSICQLLFLAKSGPQMVFAVAGIILSIVVGLLSTREDF